ncbi:MAG: hypothetical protein JST44_19585 [Cyanobacteria bacterium SZAS LIN-5]|nr:hypothetical protein [Cyanobacteria bacterium SZAS LIN-5]
MGSFQVFRAGAEALAESQLGIKAAATLSEAATTASRFLSEAYPSAKGMIAKASDMFRSPQTASSLSLEGAGEMTAAERAATPGGKAYQKAFEAYERERAIGFNGTRDLINQTRTPANGFDALSRQVEKLQGIGLSSGGSELPRSLEGIRKSFQPVAANLELGSARSANLHSFVPGESGLATRIQPSTLRYPPIESQVVGTTTARAEKVTAAARTEQTTVAAQEAESGTGTTEAVAKVRSRRRGSKVNTETPANGEAPAGNEAVEATTSGRRTSSRRTSKVSETAEENAGDKKLNNHMKKPTADVPSEQGMPGARSQSSLRQEKNGYDEVAQNRARARDQIEQAFQPSRPKAEARVEPVKAEAPKPEPAKAEAPKPEPAKAEAPAKTEPVKAEAPKPEPAKVEAPVKPEPAKAEAPVKPEPAKAEAPKPEPAKAEAPATVDETATVAEVVEGEATGPAGQNLNRAARRKLDRAARHDRRRGPSPQEQEARDYQRA